MASLFFYCTECYSEASDHEESTDTPPPPYSEHHTQAVEIVNSPSAAAHQASSQLHNICVLDLLPNINTLSTNFKFHCFHIVCIHTAEVYGQQFKGVKLTLNLNLDWTWSINNAMPLLISLV